MPNPKVGLFFGAGAEIAYGLPSGGRFALEVFRMDASEDKQEFKEAIRNVKSRSSYAAQWLPENYDNRPVSTYGKSQYEGLLTSSFEHRRVRILAFLRDFDKQAKWVVQDLASLQVDVDQALESEARKPVGGVNFKQDVILNDAFKQKITLFESHYFSALLQVLIEQKKANKVDRVLKDTIRSIMELLVGAAGEEMLHSLNDAIFTKKPDDIDIFDDFCGFFKMDYRRLGLDGLELVLTSSPSPMSAGSSSADIARGFAIRMLEAIYVEALDYQTLLDANYHYLFQPRTDWGKFCKIAIFLKTVRRYILQDLQANLGRVQNGDGYYHDLSALSAQADLCAIGTTNYNTFVQTVLAAPKPIHLNGSVDDFYDPYKNKILTELEAQQSDHITVPFLFTQSGVKPMTSVDMSRRYVQLFDDFKSCDAIGVVGFGFNSDDGHINGLFRQLIEDEGKRVVVFDYDGRTTKQQYMEKLRLETGVKLTVEAVDRQRQCSGQKWFEKLAAIAANP
jgi:hypothetical protein